MNIAIVNFARTRFPVYGEKMVGFRAFTQAVYQQAEESRGLVGFAQPVDRNEHLSFFKRDWGDWGRFALPRYYEGSNETDTIAQASALSVWRSISDLRNFVYCGVHLRSIQRRHEWFKVMEEPGYGLWWTESSVVTWQESVMRLEHIQDFGATPNAFTFRRLFDSDGSPLTLSECLARGL